MVLIREVIELFKNYYKLVKVYDLFDGFDNNFIRFFFLSILDFNDIFFEIFIKIYYYEVVLSCLEKKFDI